MREPQHRRKSHGARKRWTWGYGAFPGGDPRDFTPDEDGQTPEEREAYARACEAAAAGAPSAPAAHAWLVAEEAVKLAGGFDSMTIGGGAAHVAFTRFGLGTYRLRDAMISRRDRRKMEREAAVWVRERIAAITRRSPSVP